MTFGDIIRHSREQLQLSQDEVAKEVEKKYGVRLSSSYLSMIENGARTNLTVNLINALLRFFDLPVEAVSSLFHKGTADAARQTFKEHSALYDSYPSLLTSEQLALLPAEARHSIYEFQAFIWMKYAKKNRKNKKSHQV